GRRISASYVQDGGAWPVGWRERGDSLVFATGARAHMPYLRSLGLLDEAGAPRHDRGGSTVPPGLAFLGLEFQRSFSSNTLRGVHRDAGYVVDALARQQRGGVDV